MKNRSSKRGFTLVEIMIVIIILGLLAALVVPNLIGKGEEAKQKLVCVQMKSIAEALNMFKADNGSYPDTEEGIDALLKNPNADKYKNYSASGYLSSKSVPVDPWKNKFIYINNGSSFEIISLGADKAEGGEGEGKDIKFSECGK
jgi:general secretion pathway protein G